MLDLGQMPAQMGFLKLLENLFHFKLDQERYSIQPDKFISHPLFDDTVVASNTYLNEFFFLVLSRFFHWQSMSTLVPVDDEGAAIMARSTWSALPATSSGPAMPAIPTISKKMVAYLESFLGVAPFRKPAIDTRIDKLYADAMKRLGYVTDDRYVAYLVRKLQAWYSRFPPKAVDPAADKAELDAAADKATVDVANLNGDTEIVEGLVLSDAE